MTIRHRRWRPARYLTLTAAALAVIAVLPGGEEGAVAPVEPAATGAQAIIDASLAVAAAEPVETASPDAGAVETLTTTATSSPQAAAISPDRERPPLLAGTAPETRLAAVAGSDRASDSRSTSGRLPTAVTATVARQPGTTPANEVEQTRVGSSALNVRAGPTSSAGKLFVLRPGQPVTILERDGNWARITTASGERGWVYSRYLADGPAAAADQTSTRTVAAVANAPANAPAASPSAEADRSVRHARIGSAMPARAAPSRNAAPLFTLPSGARVKIAETQGRWLRVVTDSGVSGWIRYR